MQLQGPRNVEPDNEQSGEGRASTGRIGMAGVFFVQHRALKTVSSPAYLPMQQGCG
jgi:hypothetical protein